MTYVSFIWDLDDDPGGNVQHCARHDVSKEEVQEAFHNIYDIDFSRSSGFPIAFGETNDGRHLAVIYQEIDEETVRPVTAYAVPRRKFP